MYLVSPPTVLYLGVISRVHIHVHVAAIFSLHHFSLYLSIACIPISHSNLPYYLFLYLHVLYWSPQFPHRPRIESLDLLCAYISCHIQVSTASLFD